MSESIWGACRGYTQAPALSGAERGAAETDSGTRNAGKPVTPARFARASPGDQAARLLFRSERVSARRRLCSGEDEKPPSRGQLVFKNTPERKIAAEGRSKARSAAQAREARKP